MHRDPFLSRFFFPQALALSLEDKIIVSRWNEVTGLERRIVIGMMEFEDECDSNAVSGRLHGMSRCTGQLIWCRSIWTINRTAYIIWKINGGFLIHRFFLSLLKNVHKNTNIAHVWFSNVSCNKMVIKRNWLVFFPLDSYFM